MFLKKINPRFKKEIDDFIKKNEEQYKPDPQAVSLFEDMLIIQYYKRKESDIQRKKRGVFSDFK